MSADPVADQSADVLHLPGSDPRAELDGSRKGALLHLPLERRRRKREDSGNKLRLADIARCGQRTDRMEIVWHVTELHEARLRVMECTQLGPLGRNCESILRNCGERSVFGLVLDGLADSF